MILATTKVEDFDRFLKVFSTKGAEKRKQHGSKGATHLSRSQRGRPGLGALRLGRGGLAELRLRPRGPAHPSRSRAQGQAPGGGARRPATTPDRSQVGDHPKRTVLVTRSSPTSGSEDMRNRAPIKVGVIADQTGPLSFMGIANANVAKMVIDDINAKGGLLGRQVDLYLEDSATTDSVAEAKAAKLVEQDHVDVILGGIYSSTRQAIKRAGRREGQDALHLPGAVRGAGMRPAHLLHRPGARAAARAPLPWLMQQTGAKKFYLPSADYIWPHIMNEKVRELVTANGGEIVGEEYFPLDHTDYGKTIDTIMSSGAEVVFNTIVPPGLTPFLEQLYDAGLHEAGGHLVCTYFDENFLNLVPAEHVEGLYGCLDYYQDVERSVQQGAARAVRQALSGQRQVHRRQRVLRPVPRSEALGGRGEGGGLARAGSGHQGTGPREDRRRGRAVPRRWCPVSITFG